ncbi:hypothetical protein TVAG_025920 [Trichomonas vaginalis G3]|uniref:DUF3447 domain-containing protein n=1 Tax=Trichomonas vaginalis (strain ATCC PRA-98 / G3) TaxID=412133 RepID=A2G1Y9_TRIV3|nr:proteasome regulatory particle assembly [Trichomonas vaginalis G3]EAX88824.1 hypothetical protein TVAG_025920 [Trichomonas vaginalis G3]KAI5531580.1 proteasome regulatory particle assembly [Trichomonas vaginalis G3]|eukprot:XP_001301754.1 hypothetical protein [Trichomonas vaginalis G3]
MEIIKDYNDAITAIYRLKTYKEEEIETIYQLIKRNLIETKFFTPSQIIHIIESVSIYNNEYMMSYLILFKRIYDEYNPINLQNIGKIFAYLIYKEYGIIIGKSYEYGELGYIATIHPEGTIWKAIMDDDKQSFIVFTQNEGFNKDKTLICELYSPTKDGLSYLELCCYHGSVSIFKYLREEFNSEITETCVQFAFLSGNPDILSECINQIYTLNRCYCMKFAIISHNIDFVTYLMNEHAMKISPYECSWYLNILAFIVYMDSIKDFNKGFVESLRFNHPALCEYFLSKGAKIDNNSSHETVLHYAAEYCNGKIIDLLISHGADVLRKNKYKQTALHLALEYNNQEAAEVLISRGANIKAKDNLSNQTALHIAAKNNCVKIVELLISHGAKIDIPNNEGETPLHYAAYNNSKEALEILVLHGADVKAKTKYGKTALDYMRSKYNKEIVDILVSHGA